jgi:predicted nucleotidyltransferase
VRLPFNVKIIQILIGTRYIPLIVDKLLATQPEKIILFGSYAYGEPNINSDLDILVVTGDENIPASFSEKSKIYLRISKAISDIKKEFSVDLIVHTKPMHQKFIEIDSLFARELLSKGKVLYEKNS